MQPTWRGRRRAASPTASPSARPHCAGAAASNKKEGRAEPSRASKQASQQASKPARKRRERCVTGWRAAARTRVTTVPGRSPQAPAGKPLTSPPDRPRPAGSSGRGQPRSPSCGLAEDRSARASGAGVGVAKAETGLLHPPPRPRRRPPSEAGTAGPGRAWHGVAWHGMAWHGVAWHAWHGAARRGAARRTGAGAGRPEGGGAGPGGVAGAGGERRAAVARAAAPAPFRSLAAWRHLRRSGRIRIPLRLSRCAAGAVQPSFAEAGRAACGLRIGTSSGSYWDLRPRLIRLRASPELHHRASSVGYGLSSGLVQDSSVSTSAVP
eukprot:scaffold382_cov380-Prasinococcus_capsulatus_cf.AAC.6